MSGERVPGWNGSNNWLVKQKFLRHIWVVNADSSKADIDLSRFQRLNLFSCFQFVQYDLQVFVSASPAHH